MPALNSAAYVEEALRSVLAQSFGNFELIFSDDGSRDETVSIAEWIAAADRRVRVLRNPEPAGPARNRNFALRHAIGKWLALLDADDVWPSNHLELFAAAVTQRPDFALCFADLRRFSRSVDDASHEVLQGKGFFAPKAEYTAAVSQLQPGIELYEFRPEVLLKHACLWHFPISTGAATLIKDLLDQNGRRFRESWTINEDFDVWMRMLLLGPVVAIRRALHFYRLSSSGLTGEPIRYMEGMAQPHCDWMRRIRSGLTRAERGEYKRKVGGFLFPAVWAYYERGAIGATLWAHLRGLQVLPSLVEALRLPMRVAHASLMRLRNSRKQPVA